MIVHPYGAYNITDTQYSKHTHTHTNILKYTKHLLLQLLLFIYYNNIIYKNFDL